MSERLRRLLTEPSVNRLMRLGRWIGSGALALLVLMTAPARAQAPYRDSTLRIEIRVRDLLRRMTTDEKFWQLFMIPGGPVGRTDSTEYRHGIFGLQNRNATTARSDAELQNAMQHFFVDSTRLGIPVIPFEEAVHGLMRRGATVYPAAIALAATFDTNLGRDVAEDIAREARARGIRQVLSQSSISRPMSGGDASKRPMVRIHYWRRSWRARTYGNSRPAA